MLVNIQELRSAISKLNLAIEKVKLNPKSGWVEIMYKDKHLIFKVSNYDYFVKISVNADTGCEEMDDVLHATISSDTFVPLISKLESDKLNFSVTNGFLIVSTDGSSYTFPIIEESGLPKSLNEIKFNSEQSCTDVLLGTDLSSIASVNSKGFADSIISSNIQSYIYVDNVGAITFTDSVYVNNFNNKYASKFSFLLNVSQAKLLNIFKDYNKVELYIDSNLSAYDSPFKIRFRTTDIDMIMIVQSRELTDKFPSIKLRSISENSYNSEVVIDKKKLEKALTRLMVFDKKFDITVLNYSKLIWGSDSVKLVSIKNNNYEVVKYESSRNAIEYESMIRFADILKQLKTLQTSSISISYGDFPAIIINNNDGVKQLIPEVVFGD